MLFILFKRFLCIYVCIYILFFYFNFAFINEFIFFFPLFLPVGFLLLNIIFVVLEPKSNFTQYSIFDFEKKLFLFIIYYKDIMFFNLYKNLAIFKCSLISLFFYRICFAYENLKFLILEHFDEKEGFVRLIEKDFFYYYVAEKNTKLPYLNVLHLLKRSALFHYLALNLNIFKTTIFFSSLIFIYYIFLFTIGVHISDNYFYVTVLKEITFFYNCDFIIGVDSISLLFIVLIVFIFPLIFINFILYKGKNKYLVIKENIKELVVLLLVTELFLLLTFYSINFFFFFFECSLIPLILFINI